MRKCIFIFLPLSVILTVTGIWFFANNRARNIVDERIAEALASGAYDEITYESLNILPNGDVELQNLTVEAEGLRYTLQDISVRNLDYVHELPWHLTVEVNGIHFPEGLPADTDNPVADDLLRSLISDSNIPLNLVYGYNYDPDQMHQIDTSGTISLPQFFRLGISTITRNIPLETMAGNASLYADPLSNATLLGTTDENAALVSASMTLNDEGIVESVIALMAQRSGVPPEDFRNLLVSQSRNFYLFAPQTAQNLAMNLGSQLATFLEGGQELSVSVEPQMEGRIMQLQGEIMGAAFTGDFDRIADLLNLQVQAL